MLLPLVALAHGLLLDADSDGSRIFGAAYYSNGEKAANESVALLDLSVTGAQPINQTTDVDGKFLFDAIGGHHYRVAVYGEEGHSVEVELIAAANTTPVLIESPSSSAPAYWPPPAWAMIGGVLLLSLIPVIRTRQRQQRQ